MRIIHHAALLIALLAATDAAAQDCTDRRVAAELAELRAELDGAEVHCATAARGNLDGDRARDAVLRVSFEGIGGGNNWGSILYVLLGDRSAPLLEEPEVERGAVDSVMIAGREIRVTTLEHREGDGRCCPSGKDAFALRVENRRLVRVPVRGW